jgi:hypothetical protein
MLSTHYFVSSLIYAEFIDNTYHFIGQILPVTQECACYFKHFDKNYPKLKNGTLVRHRTTHEKFIVWFEQQTHHVNARVVPFIYKYESQGKRVLPEDYQASRTELTAENCNSYAVI